MLCLSRVNLYDKIFPVNTKIFFIGLLLLLLTPLIFVITGRPLPLIGKKKKAGLYIKTTPKATVFLNEIQQGTTPFDKEDLKAQEYKVKLEPEGDLVSWEGRVSLVAGRKTVINREFAASEALSSGYVLTLEQSTDKETASLTIITDPDNSVITLDGEPRGFAPITIKELKAGDHLLLVTSSGYKEKRLELKLIQGYRLNASLKLAQSEEMEEEEEEEEATEAGKKKEEKPSSAEASESKEATISASLEGEDEMERPYVKIKETGTGWLRVRSDPVYQADNSNEVAKVEVGGVYKFLDQTESGWYQIEYEEAESGWISGQYAEKYD